MVGGLVNKEKLNIVMVGKDLSWQYSMEIDGTMLRNVCVIVKLIGIVTPLD